MSTITIPAPELSEDTRRALTIYDERLKAILEPDQNGKGLAIHTESGDYEVADTPFQAGRALRLRHPGEKVVMLKVGLEPEYALAARYLAGLMSTGSGG